MKQIYLTLTLAIAFITMDASAQTCADIKIKKGSVLHYEQESAPPQIKTLDYFKKRNY